MAATLLPTVLLAWYLGDPAHNQPIVIRLEHFVITSNVSVVAALVAFLVARAALGVGHYRALLIALGFASMAAIFAVHGLATPGVLEQGDREAPAQLVLGVSAELALAVAYVLLAQAQVSQFLGPIWTPSWWEYHGLMLAAVVLAMGALILELDRRRGLERFLPATVVERVIQGDPLRLEGERQTVTILFTDLRGSTSLAERLTPEQTIAAVNAYLRVMARCVLDNGGILDKFTGDGVMASFGAMSDPTNGALSAVRAALAMRASIAQLNAARAGRGEVVVQFGMGLHTGDVVVGAVGLPERSQYDAIGDAVNTASRMETLTKEFQVDSIVSKDTAERLRADGVGLRPLGEAHVKGKAKAIEVFTLA